MKIGITGASGVLGNILIEKIKHKRYEYNSFEGDITEVEDIKKWVNNNKFDSILHLAAIVPPSDVKKNLSKAFAVNSVGTKSLVDVLVEKSNMTWLFYASTSHVYKSNEEPISEYDEIEPISEYGLTKYAGEILLKKNYKNFCIGRIFSMYHDTQKPPFLYPNIKKRLETEDLSKEFELYGAESTRDFLNAEEIADIILQLMEKEALGVYNIASGKGIKIGDFVKNMTSRQIKIKDMGGKDSLVANIDKLKDLLNEENKV
jgi:nucleoside-diphosphate-sugar epimerase